MAVYTGLRLPEIFGRVLSQSGVFETEGRDFVAVELIRHAPARPRIYMDVGRLDSLQQDNRRVVPLLRERGFDLTYQEHGGGHNYTSWRDHVHLGLERLFG
jgi:enterochelin esterase family protein